MEISFSNFSIEHVSSGSFENIHTIFVDTLYFTMGMYILKNSVFEWKNGNKNRTLAFRSKLDVNPFFFHFDGRLNFF